MCPALSTNPSAELPETHGADVLEAEPHDQTGESLRILWRKVWPGLTPASQAALLPQGMQGQLPCKKGEGQCAREKVAEPPVSRSIAISARMSSAENCRLTTSSN